MGFKSIEKLGNLHRKAFIQHFSFRNSKYFLFCYDSPAVLSRGGMYCTVHTRKQMKAIHQQLRRTYLEDTYIDMSLLNPPPLSIMYL